MFLVPTNPAGAAAPPATLAMCWHAGFCSWYISVPVAASNVETVQTAKPGLLLGASTGSALYCSTVSAVF